MRAKTTELSILICERAGLNEVQTGDISHKGTVFQMPKRDRAKERNPPGVKGLRPLKSQNSLLTKLPIIRGKTHGEQKG